MKIRISFIADGSNILGIVQALANNTVPVEGIYIEPVQDGETITATQKQALAKAKHTKAKPKRKPGRPAMGIPGKVLAAVRQLQDSAVAKNGGGAPLTEIKKIVKSPSTSPVLTDLIKHKKLARVSTGHYRVA